MEAASKAYYSDPNGVPREGDGRVTHLGLKESELAQRVVTVGSLSRAQTLLQALDEPDKASVVTSSRGFTTYTGTFGSTPVSIVATGTSAPPAPLFRRTALPIGTLLSVV